MTLQSHRGAALPLLAAAVCMTSPLAAAAQSYPVKPVRVVVPFSPGGGTDIQARLLVKSFHDSTGQTFVVDNRAGASGLIGGQIVVDSPADGYTILFTTATIAVNTTLYGKRMKFHPLKDLESISWVSSAPLVLCVHPSVPAKSVNELVAIAKSKPGFLMNGVNTPGSTSHLSGEMLKQLAGISTTIVPYKGGGPSMNALISGEIDFLFATGPVAAQQIKANRVRALAVSTPKKASAFPDLPTIGSIYPGFATDNWYAMFFPKGTNPEFVAKINGEIRKALQTTQVREFMKREGIDAVGSSPQEMREMVQKEIDKYAKVIRDAKIKF